MTQRDFKKLAEHLNKAAPVRAYGETDLEFESRERSWATTALAVANACKEINNRFDHDQFMWAVKK